MSFTRSDISSLLGSSSSSSSSSTGQILQGFTRSDSLRAVPLALPELSQYRPLELRIMPDFSQTEQKRELKFEVLTTVEFDKISRELRPDVLWFASARKHVYSCDNFEEFIQTKAQTEFPVIRFVLNNDMSLMFASDGQTTEEVAAHGQMTKYNAEALVGGSIARRMEGQRMIIEGGNNQTSGLRSDFNKIQLAFIQLIQSNAYKQGLITFDETKELLFMDANPASKKVYYITAAKLIAQLEDLVRIYAETILTPEKLAEYAAKKDIFDTMEVPEGLSAKEYRKTQDYLDLIEASAQAYRTSSRSTSTTAAPENTPFKRQPPPTPSRRRDTSSAPESFLASPGHPVLPSPLAAVTSRLMSAPYPSVFLHDPQSPFKPANLRFSGIKREGDEKTVARDEGERQRPRR
jgi:hypothetical protein